MYSNVKLERRMSQLGYRQAELARAVNAETERLTGRPGSLTDADIRRWLRGDTKWPQDRIRLCVEKVLQCSAEDLGFIRRAKKSPSPSEEEDVRRRKFLTATGGTALAIAAPSCKRLGLSDVDRFHQEYIRILEDDWRVGGLRKVENHAAELALRICSALSAGTASTEVRKRLHRLASDATSSAAFAAIDAKSHKRARMHLEKAVTFAGLSGDSETQYHVWNHLAMTACQHEEFSESAAAADVMKSMAIARRDPVYASLGHMRKARSLAKMGHSSETLCALRAAEKSFDRADIRSRPAWISFYDHSEMLGLTAGIWFALGQYERAEYFFHQTLSGIRPEMIRNRALYTTHLALSQARQGELELACFTSSKAYDSLPPGSGSKRTTDMLVKVRQVLISSGSRSPEVTEWIERSRQWT
ncbi:XRE family transcriptional regulator [Streptomyces sp. CC224B]|uniref:XRE family transcriptional regulator n=1 Tax=Streptomyces sp. CC224B TaxID=3044571 RepID=UPI0024A969B8|nr:XRE family transcriptional regulator [Streptomyces sp. CC224B]